jgi:hypothetical protein
LVVVKDEETWVLEWVEPLLGEVEGLREEVLSSGDAVGSVTKLGWVPAEIWEAE